MVDVAHLERMGRELKCPICLGLLISTVSLSCNHMFCSLCISKSMKSGSSCPVCKVPYTRREVRPAPHMDSLVEIYKNMELASGVNIFLSQAPPSMGRKGIEDKWDLGELVANKPPGAKRKKQGLSKVGAVKSINESPESHKVVAPSFFKKKRVQISPHPRRTKSESPIASDNIRKLDCNGPGGGKGKSTFPKSSSGREDNSDVGHEGYPPAASRGTDGFDQERNMTLSPFFWLREQDDDEETDRKRRDQQLEIDHVTDTPTYAMPAFSDLKDSEDGSPEKREVDSRFKHENLFDSEMFEWTQRPGSPELHSMSASVQGTEHPSSVEKEQSNAPDHLRNQVCEQELYATKRGSLSFEFMQSANTADTGSGLLTRSQKSSTSKTKSRRVRGRAKATKEGSVNSNNDATPIMGGGPHQLMDEKEGNEHLLVHAHIHATVVNVDPKTHGDKELNNVDHLEDANGNTLSPAKKANKKVRKASKKNTQTYMVEEDNTKTRAHGSSDTRSDERLDDIPRKFAVEKLCYDPSGGLDGIGDDSKDQICNRENGKIDKLLPAIDLPNPERSEINVFGGKANESNVKRCTRKKWKIRQISRTQKICTVSVRENDPEHSPTERTCEPLLGITELPDNTKSQISEADTHAVDEGDDKEGPRPKRHKNHYSREETRRRTRNSCSTINQVNSCGQKKRKGAEISIVCNDLEPVLEENFDCSNEVFREPKISRDSKCLQDKDANGPAKAVEVVAGKDLMLQRCESKSPPLCCIFCRSLDEKGVCGEMLHFANGRIVSSDYNGGFAFIHAHRNCAEWAPDVYFDDETVLNLEKEVARSKRIRCTDCGIKGAALGCYDKSCRKSYHFPCAKSIAECRWDMESFVMLCPLHSSLQLPKEKEQSAPQNRRIRKASQMKIVPFQPTNNTPWRWTSGTSPKWVLCCSALGNTEKELVSKFGRIAALRISKTWCSSVTHVIASIDENGACRRTLKVLMGILEGKWIVNINWVKACLEIMEPVDERPYEITGDIHGFSNGPQRGRMRLMEKELKLFNGFRFYFIGDFASSYKGYLQDLIVAAGGTVLQRKPVASASQETFVLYNLELPEKCKPSEASSVVEGRRREAEAMARASGAHAVSHSWVLDSIAACSLQPLT